MPIRRAPYHVMNAPEAVAGISARRSGQTVRSRAHPRAVPFLTACDTRSTCYLRRDAAAAAHWAAVQRELKAIAPRPGAGDLDIYRSARNLIGGRGTQDAWRHAMQQGVEAGDDLQLQAHWLRVADAVNALAQGHTKDGA